MKFVAKGLAVAALGCAALAGCSHIASTATHHPSTHAVSSPSAAPMATDPNGQTCSSLNGQGYCPGDAPAVSASAPSTPAPSTAAPVAAPSTSQAPAMTNGQQQAVTAAQGYLSDGQGFSEQGLLQQLTSQYGSGFSTADAQFAINYLNPDWDQQAVESARGYLNDGQGFSRASLLQQLTSQYGSGFTYAQAEYALSQVGM